MYIKFAFANEENFDKKKVITIIIIFMLNKNKCWAKNKKRFLNAFSTKPDALTMAKK